ncbi:MULTISPECIES: NAD(P)/FAD-dependent oxidoreductase [unclassified Aureispira]|uniref:NAD(P)/FAD-dependent oxidoreductase n=1 Tax=unclassified Aureispira TaxID=2649989 RepID=UPI000696E301|nr:MULTISPECIES: NAD(P)/FAD-dependent oxidoreductase [unclassified Aureispira]WMX15464.1 NAD(P)/FAD-dependent oxidoreductase [Aureispira sp. CCB-E]
MNVPHRDLPRIVIIGCGFGGLKLAKSINTNQYQVVLFDKNNYHTFQPLMYQVASAGLEPDSIVYPIRKVFNKKENFHFRMADVHEIDAEKKLLHTSVGTLDYDYLVMATGAVSNFFGMENVEKHSMPMKSLVEALNLRSVILQNFEKALNSSDVQEQDALMNFVIVGGGATGVELAGALAELKRYILPKDYPDLDIRRMQIHVVQGADRLLPGMSEKASADSERFLRKMGVNVWLDIRAQDYDGTTVYTNKETFKAKTLIWTAGVKGAPTAGLDASQTTNMGRVLVNEWNQINGYKDVFAIGDVAAMTSEELPYGHPMLASVAVQQGVHLGKNFNRLAKEKEMLPFVYKDKGTMATIGRNLAVVDMKRLKFGGWFAWLMWMFVHLMLLVDFRSRLVVFVNWAWSYFFYDKGTRLIVRKVKNKAVVDCLEDEVPA